MSRSGVRGAILIGVVTLLIVGCQGGEEARPPPSAEPEYQGVSIDEMERQAEEMTLEEAEALGIVDTTIRIEPPMHPDSVIPTDTM